MKVESTDLCDIGFIAERFDVGKSAVTNWANRHEDFPKPIEWHGSYRLFLWSEVEKWGIATERLVLVNA